MFTIVGGGEDVDEDVVISRYMKMGSKNKRRICVGVDACLDCIMVRAFFGSALSVHDCLKIPISRQVWVIYN